MASQTTIPPICPHCNQPVLADEPHRVCGFDMRRWPAEGPTNLTGHAACALGRQPIILRPNSLPRGFVRPLEVFHATP